MKNPNDKCSMRVQVEKTKETIKKETSEIFL